MGGAIVLVCVLHRGRHDFYAGALVLLGKPIVLREKAIVLREKAIIGGFYVRQSNYRGVLREEQ